MHHSKPVHHAAPSAGRFNVLMVACTIVLALSIVTPLGDAGVATAAALALLAQGVYAIFRRTHRDS